MDQDNITNTSPVNKEANNSIRLLIVEDDEFLRDFYQELLTSEGYQVDVAPDGEIAWNKITENNWNLILLDIMLPKKDGLQILKDLKDKGVTKQIVVLSNLGDDGIVKQAFDFGASGYLIKSVMNPDEVLAEIRNFLQQNK